MISLAISFVDYRQNRRSFSGTVSR
jgi:hypothetical protein